MNRNTLLKIGLFWFLILLSYLLSSCGTTTENKIKVTWRRQPGTSTYINQEYSIKLSFPNEKWSVYTTPQELPQGMRRFWKSSKEGNPVDVLVAQSLDNIILKLTIVYTH